MEKRGLGDKLPDPCGTVHFLVPVLQLSRAVIERHNATATPHAAMRQSCASKPNMPLLTRQPTQIALVGPKCAKSVVGEKSTYPVMIIAAAEDYLCGMLAK